MTGSMPATMNCLARIQRGVLITLLYGLNPAWATSPWELFSPELAASKRETGALMRRLEALPEFPVAQPLERAGFHSGLASDADSARWVQVDLGEEKTIDSVVIVPAIFGSSEAYGFPARFRIETSRDPLFAEPDMLVEESPAEAVSRLAPWYVPGRGVRGRYVRFTATRLASQPRKSGRFIFCLGELLVFSGGSNVALHAQVTAPKAVETPPTWLAANIVDGLTALGPPVSWEANPGNGWHSGISQTAEAIKWVQVDLGTPYLIQEVRLVPAHPSDYPDRFGFGFPSRFKIELSATPDFASPEPVFDTTGHDFANPGDHIIALSAKSHWARYVRVTATHLWERSGDFVFALAELQIISNGKNVALGMPVQASDDTFTPSWSRERLVDGKSSAGALLDESTWLQQLSERREVMDSLGAREQKVTEYTAVAQQRALWAGGAVMAGSGALLWGWLWRSRRERHRAVAALKERISRDLHDDIGSHLGSIRLISELTLRELQQGQGRDALEEIHRLSREAAESMKGIVWLVREGERPELSRLIEALRDSAASLLKGIPWVLHLDETCPSRSASLEFHRQVFLFFREAAHNIVRHAQAKQVSITAAWNRSRFCLSIADDGVGFDPDAIRSGSGLGNLQHRARALHGQYRLVTRPGEGTQHHLDVPLC